MASREDIDGAKAWAYIVQAMVIPNDEGVVFEWKQEDVKMVSILDKALTDCEREVKEASRMIGDQMSEIIALRKELVEMQKALFDCDQERVTLFREREHLAERNRELVEALEEIENQPLVYGQTCGDTLNLVKTTARAALAKEKEERDGGK